MVTKNAKIRIVSLSTTELLVDTHEKEMNLSVSLTETRKRDFFFNDPGLNWKREEGNVTALTPGLGLQLGSKLMKNIYDKTHHQVSEIKRKRK